MIDLIGLSAGIFLLAAAISMVVALLIKGVVAALPLIEGRARSESGAAAAAAAPQPDAETVPPEHVAAIGAAITAILGEHHILRIEDRGRSGVWTAEGRMIHHTSHTISHSPKP